MAARTSLLRFDLVCEDGPVVLLDSPRLDLQSAAQIRAIELLELGMTVRHDLGVTSDDELDDGA